MFVKELEQRYKIIHVRFQVRNGVGYKKRHGDFKRSEWVVYAERVMFVMGSLSLPDRWASGLCCLIFESDVEGIYTLCCLPNSVLSCARTKGALWLARWGRERYVLSCWEIWFSLMSACV